MEPIMQTKTEKYWQALCEVNDPEFPISVVDMGLIYDIELSSPEAVKVTMTYTSTGCGCMQWIEGDIRNRLLQEKEISEVIINVIWDPPWTTNNMTDKGKMILKNWGVSS